MSSNKLIQGPIIYFDGECILCNHSIKFILNRDSKKLFKIGYLKSNNQNKKIDSIVLTHKGNRYTYSTAVIKSIILLGGMYKCAILLFIFPKILRDMVYKIISKNRYKWWGKYEVCPVLPDTWKERIVNNLD